MLFRWLYQIIPTAPFESKGGTGAFFNVTVRACGLRRRKSSKRAACSFFFIGEENNGDHWPVQSQLQNTGTELDLQPDFVLLDLQNRNLGANILTDFSETLCCLTFGPPTLEIDRWEPFFAVCLDCNLVQISICLELFIFYASTAVEPNSRSRFKSPYKSAKLNLIQPCVKVSAFN